jgi:hypothetical protein
MKHSTILSRTQTPATVVSLFHPITIGFVVLFPFVLTACATVPPERKAARTRVVVEDFESYSSDEQLAKAWYKPPHGGGTHQSLNPTIKNGSKYGMKLEYGTTRSEDKFYSPICRVSKWDLSGCNALQFWFKPDGSGRALLIELNIANRQGKNIHDLWDYVYVPKKGDTAARIVTVPFSKLIKNAKYADSPDTNPVFKPEALIEVALCIGGRNDEPGDGVYYFDDLIGVDLR